MPVIATWSPVDATLDILAPLGLAAATDTCLVVDLDPEGPRLPGSHTLADLVGRGPTAAQLRPARHGTALLANGGVDASAASSVLTALCVQWPAVVLRCPPRGPRPDGAVAFVPMLPEPFSVAADPPVVHQRTSQSPRSHPGGIVLPVPARATIASLLALRAPVRRDRWLRHLRTVWSAV
jgi:hypothetical protein